MPRHLSIRFIQIVGVLLAVSYVNAQTAPRSVLDMLNEVDNFETQQRNLLASKGKRYDAAAREDIQTDRRSLAKKYASEIAERPDIKQKDLYYLALLYSRAENDKKTLETMMNFISQYPPDATGDMMQSALGWVVVLASQSKKIEVAEDAFKRWLTGKPLSLSKQPALEDQLALGYFKTGKYDQAINHAQAAFDLLKTLPASSIGDKRDREQLYMNLVEVLSLGYKKNKNVEQSLNVLAEARAESFALPSANLYRKVMTFVEGSGFSEKKLMQKVDSFVSADPAPDLKIAEWVGQEPLSLSDLRGKVVLLDFWATWCGPCISTFPRLRGWHKKYAGNDFVIIGVTRFYGEQDGKKMTNLQEIEFLRDFRDKYKLPYGFALVDRGEDASKYGINAYPTTILLDRKGVVRYIGIGSGSEESENLEDTIKKVLKEDSRLAEK